MTGQSINNNIVAHNKNYNYLQIKLSQFQLNFSVKKTPFQIHIKFFLIPKKSLFENKK